MSQLGTRVSMYPVEHIDPGEMSKVFGKRIALVEKRRNGGDDFLYLELEDGYCLRLSDRGQSCCEARYMTCDDDLKTYIRATLVSISVEDGPHTEDDHGDWHEQMFLRVSTDLGTIVVCTHNEHNGYYGGFSLEAEILPPDVKEIV